LAETGLNERLALKMLRRHVQHVLAHQCDRGAGPSRPLPSSDRMTLTDGRMDF
jgi:hypothetical protein